MNAMGKDAERKASAGQVCVCPSITHSLLYSILTPLRRKVRGTSQGVTTGHETRL